MNWHCQYCGRENYADRLTCGGCQAPHRRTETRCLETMYKGRPLSTLTDAEMDEAAAVWMDQFPYEVMLQPLPEDFMDALRRRWETL
jgi:hypothetical protein